MAYSRSVSNFHPLAPLMKAISAIAFQFSVISGSRPSVECPSFFSMANRRVIGGRPRSRILTSASFDPETNSTLIAPREFTNQCRMM